MNVLHDLVHNLLNLALQLHIMTCETFQMTVPFGEAHVCDQHGLCPYLALRPLAATQVPTTSGPPQRANRLCSLSSSPVCFVAGLTQDFRWHCFAPFRRANGAVFGEWCVPGGLVPQVRLVTSSSAGGAPGCRRQQLLEAAS